MFKKSPIYRGFSCSCPSRKLLLSGTRYGGAAVAAGIIGGAIVGAAIAESLKQDPVVVTPAPVVVPQPVVVQQPIVVAQPVTQVQNVWVEGRYVHRRDAHGRMVRVWEPGHYEQRTVVVTP